MRRIGEVVFIVILILFGIFVVITGWSWIRPLAILWIPGLICLGIMFLLALREKYFNPPRCACSC